MPTISSGRYKGEKKDTVIKNIAKTFVALCDYADFSSVPTPKAEKKDSKKPPTKVIPSDKPQEELGGRNPNPLDIQSLQYHINIVLPDTRDQAVYDAIFKSMRDHLG